METPHSTSASWFRSRGGRRYGIEFALIVGVKLILLVVLWAVVIRPQPHPDTAPAAVARHLFAPVAEDPHDR